MTEPIYCHHDSCTTDTLLELSHLLRYRSRDERVRLFTATLRGPVRCRHVPRDPDIPFTSPTNGEPQCQDPTA